MRRLRAFVANQAGASAAEFVLVLPVMLLFLFGIIDAGRYIWLLNQLEKGAQAGARYAVVTDIVPSALNAYDPIGFVCANGEVIRAADRICPEALGRITCTANGGVTCSCDETPCPGAGAGDAAAFASILGRIRLMAPLVRPGNVAISYSGSGLGYADDPRVTDAGDPLSPISPLVTVTLANVDFRALVLFGGSFAMPPVSSSLSLEDGTGTIGY